LGDRNYWSPDLTERLEEEGLSLLAPYKSKKREGTRWPSWLVRKRRRIETVISQMAERYRAKRLWARDRWHLTSRWLRKVLSTPWPTISASKSGSPRFASRSSLPTKLAHRVSYFLDRGSYASVLPHAYIHPSDPWPLPGHPEAMKMSWRQGPTGEPMRTALLGKVLPITRGAVQDLS
jgi:hypothetical protein